MARVPAVSRDGGRAYKPRVRRPRTASSAVVEQSRGREAVITTPTKFPPRPRSKSPARSPSTDPAPAPRRARRGSKSPGWSRRKRRPSQAPTRSPSPSSHEEEEEESVTSSLSWQVWLRSSNEEVSACRSHHTAHLDHFSYAFLHPFITFWLACFSFVAFAFEPFLFICADGFTACVKQRPDNLIVYLWWWYADTFDPIFLNTPGWLKLMCALDGAVFGPTYVALLYGWTQGHSRTKWFKALVLVWMGAVVYSTIVYFSFELWYERERIDVAAVLLINAPWTVVPLLLAYLVYYK